MITSIARKAMIRQVDMIARSIPARLIRFQAYLKVLCITAP